jgi:uncharacterized glyoxalase superfamily protein PhnB
MKTTRSIKSIVANLIVESIESCLPFYVGRLGFTQVEAVPHGDKLGFVILACDGQQLMLQSRASLDGDITGIEPGAFRTALYISVEDLAPIRGALSDWPRVIPERTTFYGAREIIVRDPAGNVIALAAHEAAAQPASSEG